MCFCFVINIWFLYHFLSGWKKMGERMENLLINAEHKEEATQRKTSKETKPSGFSFTKCWVKRFCFLRSQGGGG